MQALLSEQHVSIICRDVACALNPMAIPSNALDAEVPKNIRPLILARLRSPLANAGTNPCHASSLRLGSRDR
jgi:hypothetical protein